MKVTIFMKLTKPELERREEELSIELAKLEDRRDHYDGAELKSGAIKPEDGHFGERVRDVVHGLKQEIREHVMLIVQIRSRLAEIDFREDVRNQNRRMETYSVIVGIFVLLQLALALGWIGGEKAEAETSKSAVETAPGEQLRESE